MILRNEEQRGLLLDLIYSIPMSGDYKSLSDIVRKVDRLVKDINEAKIISN